MKIVTVTTIDRNHQKGPLTYFTAKDVSVGDVVAVPVRKKTVYGLVEGLEEASKEKAAIKSSAFGLKKISKVATPPPFSMSFVAAARMTAEYYATSTGAVLSAATPDRLIHRLGFQKAPIEENNIAPNVAVLQANDADRYAHYRSCVRETFSHVRSVLILVPTIQDADTISSILSKGIEPYVHILHSMRSVKEINTSLAALNNEQHPLLIIATPGFMALAPKGIEVIIIERENSSAYKQMVKPQIDFRFLARAFAQKAGLRLIMGDAVLSLETLNAVSEGLYAELIPLPWRIPSKASGELVDMKAYKPDLRGVSEALSPELKALIKRTRESGDRTFIFAGRKGLSPATICGDCGELVLCERCGTTLTLHSSKNQKRFYICRRCGLKKEPTLRCKNCASWKLTTLGIGSELVEAQVAKAFPDLTLIRLDKESAKNRTEVLKLVEKFYDSPRSVLIGTELALGYLQKPVGAVAVASLDEFFSIPDFRIHERIFYLLLRLRGLAEKNFLVQTRHGELPLITAALEGDLSDFYHREYEIRKILSYPPFSVIISISAPAEPHATERFRELARQFRPFIFDTFPLLIAKGKGKPVISGVAKIPRSAWPNPRVLAILHTLPPSDMVIVDPENFIS